MSMSNRFAFICAFGMFLSTTASIASSQTPERSMLNLAKTKHPDVYAVALQHARNFYKNSPKLTQPIERGIPLITKRLKYYEAERDRVSKTIKLGQCALPKGISDADCLYFAFIKNHCESENQVLQDRIKRETIDQKDHPIYREPQPVGDPIFGGMQLGVTTYTDFVNIIRYSLGGGTVTEWLNIPSFVGFKNRQEIGFQGIDTFKPARNKQHTAMFVDGRLYALRMSLGEPVFDDLYMSLKAKYGKPIEEDIFNAQTGVREQADAVRQLSGKNPGLGEIVAQGMEKQFKEQLAASGKLVIHNGYAIWQTKDKVRIILAQGVNTSEDWNNRLIYADQTVDDRSIQAHKRAEEEKKRQIQQYNQNRNKQMNKLL